MASVGSGYQHQKGASSTHYLSDKNRFDISSKGPSSGISVDEGPTKGRRRADEGPLLETSNLFLSPR